jgi:hypothetical protein
MISGDFNKKTRLFFVCFVSFDFFTFFSLTKPKAGMQAVRENRYIVLAKDFEKGYKNNIKKGDQEHDFYK